MGFDFCVEYRPGSFNVVADALSRRNTVDEPEIAALSVPTFGIFNSLRFEIATSPEL
jgi:hypothetical protein